MSHEIETPRSGPLDLRDLEPPGPVVAILQALAKLEPGGTLEALLPRRPIYLLPQLDEDGHRYDLDQIDATTWRLRVTKGGG
jgi:TusA-related sulfurtransferase